MQGLRLKLAVAVGAVGLLSFSAGSIAQDAYPEITRAEGALNVALGHLQQSRDVFGSHKADAQRLISQAIGELEAAKAFAAAHGN